MLVLLQNQYPHLSKSSLFPFDSQAGPLNAKNSHTIKTAIRLRSTWSESFIVKYEGGRKGHT